MSKDKTKSRNKLQKRNITNSNGPFKKKNIFQLIEPINKNIQLIRTNRKDPFAFANNLISFLEIHHPEDLLSIVFKKDNTIDHLISSLISLIIDLEYTIVYDSEFEDHSDIQILYNINSIDWVWCLFEVVTIDKMPCEEFKIAYAYFLNKFSNSCYHSAIRSNYESTDDTQYEMEFEMLESEERYFDEDGVIDEGLKQEVEEEVHETLFPFRQFKEKINIYLAKPYSDFIEYIPKNDFEKDFKSAMIDLISIDYNIVNKFRDNENIYDEGGVSFRETFIIYFDLYSNYMESEHFRYINENANNGNSNPMGWFSISDGVVKNETSKKDIEDLFYALNAIEKIYDNFLNKI